MISDDIWSNDKLERQVEGKMLERFLRGEVEMLKKLGRDQAYVLALDAQYGEGKSWFLSRFRRQLELNSPVAFVDAWIDDASNEPLVSIMAAIEDALRPYLQKRAVREYMSALTRAALPIMGKALLGAGGKLLSKHLGDDFGAVAQGTIATASKNDKEDSALDAGIDKLVDGVSTLVDNVGKALLDQYRARQQSRRVFKDNLRQLVLAVEASPDDPRHAPIYVIVDELDRCRPDYAISLLEEIKHLFDVPGVVFVIALHGQQLTKSINAVYGAEFNSQAYLRRFFTRHYELRRLSINELVASHFEAITFTDKTFGFPQVVVNNAFVEMPPANVAGHLLSEWRATPREAQSVIDGLRLFVNNWEYPDVAIELPLVLLLLLNLVRGDPVEVTIQSVNPPEIKFWVPQDNDMPNGRAIRSERIDSFFGIYQSGISTNLPQLVRNDYENGPEAYLGRRMSEEFSRRHGNAHNPNNPPPTSWSGYRMRIRQMAPFIVTDPDGS